ncbi:MAG: hypothetical protein RSF40_11970, partial [Oscillospiraceae bacterium]
MELHKIVKLKRLEYDINMEELVLLYRVAKSTLYYHLRNIDKITYQELGGLAKKLHTSIGGSIGEAGYKI